MNYDKLKVEIFSLFSKKYAAIHAEKKEIRTTIRELKRSLTTKEKELAGIEVFRKIELLPEFKSAQTILIYWATPDELPTQQTILKWCNEKQILLPSINGDKLVLKRYLPKGKLIQKTLGIWEPDLSENYEGKVDLVIVPGIAFDRNKNRLGRGKGYYDRFFKKYKPTKIGVGFNFQLIESVPVSRHDVKMNRIFTPKETIE